MLYGAEPADYSNGEDVLHQDRTIPPSMHNLPIILSEVFRPSILSILKEVLKILLVSSVFSEPFDTDFSPRVRLWNIRDL